MSIKSFTRIAATTAAMTASALLIGCKATGGQGGTPETVTPSADAPTNVYAVVIGMENSQFAGACPGAKLDSDNMASLLKDYAGHVTLFQSEKATYKAVSAAMKEAVAKSDLFILFYSGHGGSEAFYDTGDEEIDGCDEFLCLNDTYMRDNDIWKIIKDAKCRVMLVFDCCHSATMYRAPNANGIVTPKNDTKRMKFRRNGFTMRRFIPLASASRRDGSTLCMECWSGCPDNTFSYGSSTGGMFTNCLLKHFSPRYTYDNLWGLIKADKNLKSYEDVQRTTIGTGFVGKEIFR